MHQRGFYSKSGKKIYRAKIDQLLSNPFMIGRVVDHQTGQSYDGLHEAIISAELFNKVQDVRAGRHRTKKTKHELLLRGLFQCRDCKNAMIGERQKGHVYYRCHTANCAPNSIREEVIENTIIARITNLGIGEEVSQKFSNWSLDWLSRVSELPNQDIHAVPISKIEQAMETLTEKLLTGVVDDHTYAKSKQKLLLQKQEHTENQLKQANRQQKREAAVQFLELLKNLKGLYEFAKPTEKRQMIELCFSNRTVHQKNVELSTYSWLKTAYT